MVFDSLITTHNKINYVVSNVEKIYIEQSLKLLPSHVLSKFITEGWKIVVFSDVNELIEIDSQLTVYTTGVTKYELRRIFIKSLNSSNELSFKSTLLHEITHMFDCIIEGSYCKWKTEKYYANEIENLISEEGHNFSEYARSDIKEYVSTVIARYLLNQTDFTNIPLTKAFIEKYYFMCENSLEQRLQNLENNAVTYLELDETYNKLKYSKINKENDKYTIQLPEGNNQTNNNVVYDNNVTFLTNVSYFSLNKTTISYITENIDTNITGTWELKTIIGSNSSIAIQYRNFIVNSKDSIISDFSNLPNTQKRYYDYNNSRNWTEWQDCTPSLSPIDYKGVKANRLIIQVTSSLEKVIYGYNFYVICRDTTNNELFVLNYYPQALSSDLDNADGCFMNYLTYEKVYQTSATYSPKSTKISVTTSKSICANSYWTTLENDTSLSRSMIVHNINNSYPSAIYDIIALCLTPSNPSQGTSTTNIQIKLAYEEEKFVNSNTNLITVIDYTYDDTNTGLKERQIWCSNNYNFENDIQPLLTNYDTSK